MPRRLLFAALLSAVSLAPALASASPTFPPAIQEHLGLTCEPDCTTCHIRPEGGLGTARQPFGLAMQRAGLEAGQPSKIPAALDKLEADGSDVDNDGVPDIEELREGQSPDAANTPLKCYDNGGSGGDDSGCTVQRTKPIGRADSVAVLAAAALCGALLRRQVRAAIR